MGKNSVVSPIYTGAYSRAVNRAAAGILSRKKKKLKKKKNRSARSGASTPVYRQNPVVQQNTAEPESRVTAAPLSHAAREAASPAESRTIVTPSQIALHCMFCRERVDDLADHIRKLHGTEKYVRWLLSRAEDSVRRRQP